MFFRSTAESFTMQAHPDVLVVEDDQDEQRIVRRALHQHGLDERVKIVGSGEEALEFLDRDRPHPPKVILLDLKLPGIDGHEVLRRIRADEALRTVPVVIVSSTDSDSDIGQCYLLGANSFIPKRHDVGAPGGYVIEAAHYWLDLNRLSAG